MACAYRGCEQRYQTFSSTNFFYLPVDKRRDLWIQNSGNSKLKLVPSSKKVRFCETHFDPVYFRRQFSRTTLRRDAIPYSYSEINKCRRSLENTSANHLDKSQEDNVSTRVRHEEVIELVTEVAISSFLDTETENDLGTFSNENLLEEDYLEEPTELIDIIEHSNYAEFKEDEIDCSSIDKTFIDDSTQTELMPSSASGEYDEDEHFVLSLIEPLRRLPKHMKISTRLSILEIIARCEAKSK